MKRITSFFVTAALALTLSVSSVNAITISGAFTSLGVHHGADVIAFEITTDTALNGLDFTVSGGFGFHGLFHNVGFGDGDFNGIPDPFSFAPVFYPTGPPLETWFVFTPVGLNVAQLDDATNGSQDTPPYSTTPYPPTTPSTVLAGALSVAVGDLLPIGTTTVAVFSLVTPGSGVLLGNGSAFGIAGVATTQATGLQDFPIVVIPEPASFCLLGLGLVGTFATRRRSNLVS